MTNPIKSYRIELSLCYSMSPKSGYRFWDKDLRQNKDLKRKELIRKITTCLSEIDTQLRSGVWQVKLEDE